MIEKIIHFAMPETENAYRLHLHDCENGKEKYIANSLFVDEAGFM